MTELLNLVENTKTSEFYPTPEELADKMVSCIDFDYTKTILEPSAGKGDLIMALSRKAAIKYRYNSNGLDVDAIEIDPNLRQILSYNFSEKKEDELRDRISELEHRASVWNSNKREYENHLTEKEKAMLVSLKKEKDKISSCNIHIVCDNFLSYEAFKEYDLILMNPPFSNGDTHLLKALDIQKYGGSIVCLLNAETIRNPYTPTRKALVEKLAQYNADIEYIKNAFTGAERATDVEVALIRVTIPAVQQKSDIFEKFEKAQEYDEPVNETSTELEIPDYIQKAINRYKVELRAGIELIRQYRAMIPYMTRSFEEDSKDPILLLVKYASNSSYHSVSINDYVKCVRRKYWHALLSNPKFTNRLTSKLQTEYSQKVESLSAYDFTDYNIKILVAEMNANVKRGIEEEIELMYDRLTSEHSWYPETKNNKHYYDGWATNKAHKIDKKVILPTWGVFSSWDGQPRVYEAEKVLSDIERILNFLDGHMTEEVDLFRTLDLYFRQGITKKVPLKYFNATFYKKGTVHLVFTCPELIERFNIYAAQKKSWLPPCYGKKQYKDMTQDEKQVIDSFQGEKAYNDVLARSNYYLAPVTNNQTLMLEG